jgi:hypothetical protein
MQPDGAFQPVPQTPDQGMVRYEVPVVEASADGSQAVGVYSPGKSYFNTVNISWAAVDKWDCAYWGVAPVVPATFTMTCYVAVGTLAEVEASLLALKNM